MTGSTVSVTAQSQNWLMNGVTDKVAIRDITLLLHILSAQGCVQFCAFFSKGLQIRLNLLSLSPILFVLKQEQAAVSF